MIKYDFQKSTGFWLGSATSEIERALTRALAPHGITLPQVRVLACLALTGGLAQHELAEMLNLERSTVARGVDRMEREGLVKRETHPVDRRQKVVTAAEAVVPKWKTIVEAGEEVERRAIKGISKTDLKVVRSVCERILANLGESQS